MLFFAISFSSLLIVAAILTYQTTQLKKDLRSLTSIYEKAVGEPRVNKITAVETTLQAPVFPESGTKTTVVASLLSLTKQYDVKSDQGEYLMTASQNSMLVYYRIRLPVRGTYQAIRKFVAQALHDNSSLALDRISFSRSKIDEPTVDAELVMTLIHSNNS